MEVKVEVENAKRRVEEAEERVVRMEFTISYLYKVYKRKEEWRRREWE